MCGKFKMDIYKFIKQNEAQLKKMIKQKVPNAQAIDENEMRLWILNDEGIYNWAKQSGVDI